jgi:hypothetical protein
MTCFGQYIISGAIKDSTATGIGYVSVTLLNPTDRSVLAYKNADAKGMYSIGIKNTGLYILAFSDMQYQTKELSVELNGVEKLHKIDVTLFGKSRMLNDVIVTATKAPIIIKKDTIVYDINSFKQGNERVIEDLLRKLPGINIDDDGNITANGKTVEKVMVEGDDFFERGYKVLTKNMPIQPVEKVELLQHYSANKLLKNIEQSDKVALNLKLKDAAKSTWFGNIEAGLAPAKTILYDTRINLMNFGKKTKYYFLTAFNNIGYDATGDVSLLTRPTIGEQNYLNGDESIQPAMISDFTALSFKKDRFNFNQNKLLTVNAIHNPVKNLKIKTQGFFNWDKNSLFQSTIEKYQLPGASFTNTTDFFRIKNPFTGFGKINIDYELTSLKSLNMVTSYNYGTTDNNSDLVFNNIQRPESLYDNNKRFDHHILFTNRLSDKDVVLISENITIEQLPQKYKSSNFMFAELFPNEINANNISQNINNTMGFYGANATWLHRTKRNDLFMLVAGDKFRIDNFKSVFNINENNTTLNIPSGYQNDMRFTTNTVFLNGSFGLTVKNFTVTPKIDLLHIHNTLTTSSLSKENNLTLVNPQVGIKWEINKINKLLAQYSYNTTSNKLPDVYDNYLLTDYRSFSKGVGQIDPLSTSTYSLSYVLGNYLDRFFANTFVVYTNYADYYANKIFVTQNYSLADRILLHGKKSLNVHTDVNLFIDKLTSNFKLILGYNTNDYQDIVNTSNLRNVKTNNYLLGAEVRSSFKGIFNFNTGWKYNKNTFVTTVKVSADNSYYFFDALFNVNKKLNFQVSQELYHFGGLAGKTDYHFLDITGGYNVINNKLGLSITGKNLLNTKTFVSYSVTDIGSSTVSYRLLPRYILLKAAYTF